MQDTAIVEWIRSKYDAIVDDLDERGRRRWAAAEARSLGHGGITAVARATSMSDRTVRNGIKELDDPNALPSDRQRKPGAGRKSLQQKQPHLIDAIESLIDPGTRGDPESPLKWICKSTRAIAQELKSQGFRISSTTVSSLLKSQGYSLQANSKTREGKQHPDRDGQFLHIAARVRAQLRRREPAISVDTKKKEVLGNLKNAGATYRRKGDPIKVDVHDFPDAKLGKAIPYGVYDMHRNEAGVTLGITHDTAEFAVSAISRWWRQMGRHRYRSAKRVLITADSGGSNGSRNRLWKLRLQEFADKTGKIIEVCHFPPGTSKWNKIEHCLFCHITRNWRGVPLETLEIIVKLIGSTRTEQGLDVHAWIDEKEYPKGRKVTNAEIESLHIKPNKFHGEWNYEIRPRKK
jgi:hypothetical protein